MDRQFARNAAIALCAVWAAGCGAAGAQDTAAQPDATAADAKPAAGSDAAAPVDNLPTTLNGEIARAHLMRTKGDYKGAAQALGQLLLVEPDNAQVVGEYAKALVQQGRPQEALPFVKRALELDANDWSVYSALGVVYDQLGDHVEARASYEHALALSPNAPEVLNNYAVSRMLAGDLDGAQRMLARASAAGVGNAKIANNLAMLATMRHSSGTAAATPLPEYASTPVHRAGHAANDMAVASATPRVIMQTVPTDPQAGPVAARKAPSKRWAALHKKAQHVAAAPAHKPDDAATATHAPVLRTAADNQQ